MTLEDILANLDLPTIEWLFMELDDASYRADNHYVDPDYQDRQNDMSEAIWKIARLVEAGYNERAKG